MIRFSRGSLLGSILLIFFSICWIDLESGSARSFSGNKPSEPIDLAIVGGTLLTMDGSYRVIEDGYVAIKADRILDLGSRSEIGRRYAPKRVIDGRGSAVLPGLINTHTHVPMVVFRGIADDLALQEWLESYIFPAEGRNVSRDMCYWGALAGCHEMIQGGITTYVDMYYFEDAIAEATTKAGMRGVLGETVIDFPVADNKTPEEAIAYTERFVDRWKGSPLVVPAIAPHAPYTVRPEILSKVKEFADRKDVPVLIHLDETQREIEDIQARYGARPIAHLDKLGLINSRVIAAHVVVANDAEIRLLAERGVGVAHNPQSNMKLASGVAPVTKMLKAGIAVGLGTDGAASNNDLNLFEEMDTAAKLHKLYTNDPTAVSARDALTMATIGGARAIDMEREIGSLEKGKRADIILVDLGRASMQPIYNLYSHLVYTAKASDVRTSIINGRVVMQNRRVLTLDEAEIGLKLKSLGRQISESLQKK